MDLTPLSPRMGSIITELNLVSGPNSTIIEPNQAAEHSRSPGD
ncbi:MAG: hypothetical protein AAF716_13665 [Cyanobacteria bacterium P01_D01_bin.1]